MIRLESQVDETQKRKREHTAMATLAKFDGDPDAETFFTIEQDEGDTGYRVCEYITAGSAISARFIILSPADAANMARALANLDPLATNAAAVPAEPAILVPLVDLHHLMFLAEMVIARDTRGKAGHEFTDPHSEYYDEIIGARGALERCEALWTAWQTTHPEH